MLSYLTSFIVPPWARWAAVAFLALAAFGAGTVLEARRGANAMAEYMGKQVKQTLRVIDRQVKVVGDVQIQYRDRIQKIYLKGEEIEKTVDHYVTPVDDQRCTVNAGFVRSYDAAWAGEPARPATDADREPAGIPLSVVGETEAHNATTSRAWRLQALAWRDFYARQQVAINGKAGAWASGSTLPAGVDGEVP